MNRTNGISAALPCNLTVDNDDQKKKKKKKKTTSSFSLIPITKPAKDFLPYSLPITRAKLPELYFSVGIAVLI